MTDLVLRSDSDGVATLTETNRLAATIVANSWHTLRADKRLVDEGQCYTLAEALAFERKTSPGAGPDMAERLTAFGSKGRA